MTRSPRSQRSVSLKALFPQAVFTTGEDILAQSCSRRPKAPRDMDIQHVFVAGVGSIESTECHLQDAVRLGAKAVITERLLPTSLPQCLVGDARQAYGKLLHALAKNPSKKLVTIGVLGTHGKTSASLLIASMMKAIGGSCGYWTSLGRSPHPAEVNLASSAPSAANLASWLVQSVKAKRPAVVVEISEDMLLQRSTAGIEFDVLVIPSFRKSQRHDRLESRGIETGMMRTIEQLKSHGLVVYNADDARLNRLIERHRIPAVGYGLDADANVRGKRIERTKGSQTMMISAGHSLMPLTTPLSGDHSLRHMLAAVAVGYSFGLELFEVIGGVERMTSIPGRMQSLSCGQDFSVHVDLADQADRLAVSLHALAPLGGRVICVAEVPECASNEQRAAYGRVLSRSASRVLLTQSRRTNVRGQKLMWEVLDGCDRPAAVDLVPDRATAIELAIRSAEPGDQILLAGWGSNGWTNNRDKHSFTDKDLAEKCLYKLVNETEEARPAAVAVEGLRIHRNDA
jgi:UDP-N-acetylmuramoyl-L-alanyl-D-glutamate--2,6-diaminopimelate ligase